MFIITTYWRMAVAEANNNNDKVHSTIKFWLLQQLNREKSMTGRCWEKISLISVCFTRFGKIILLLI